MAQKKRSSGRTTPKKELGKDEISSIMDSSGVQLNRQQRRAVAQGRVKVPQDLLDQVTEMAEEHGVDLSGGEGREALSSAAAPKLPARAKLFGALGAGAGMVLGAVIAVLTGSFAALLGIAALVAVGGFGVATAFGNRQSHQALGAVAALAPVSAVALVVWERSWWGIAAVLGGVLASVVAVAIRRVFAPLPRLSAAHRTAVERQRGVLSELPLLGGMDTVVFPNGAVAVLGSVETGDAHPATHPEVQRFVSSTKRIISGSGHGFVGTLVVVDTPDFGPETIDGAVVCSASKLRNVPGALAAARR
jgi:hypothetical protein